MPFRRKSGKTEGPRFQAGDRVYNQGFLYEAVSAIPGTTWDGTQLNIGDKYEWK